LALSDALNAAGERGEPYKGKLLHISGFTSYLDPVIQDYVLPASVVILQRNLINESTREAAAYYHGLGKVIAVDLDDSYPTLPWSNPAHRFWIEDPEQRHPLLHLEQGLRELDGLVSPNRNILRDWEHACRGYHLPNFAREAWWTNLPTREEIKATKGLTGRIVIGWGGSVSHYDSWVGSGISEALQGVCRRHPEVVMQICGNDERVPYWLHRYVDRDHLATQGGVQPSDWPKSVVGFDIGVAPLFGPYDQRRSWIKGLEYLLGGVPWIGTVGEPYRDLVGLGVQIPGGMDAWESALENMIRNLKQEQELAAARVALAQGWFVERSLERIKQTYDKIKQDAQAARGQLAGIYKVVVTPNPAPTVRAVDAGGVGGSEPAAPGVAGNVEQAAGNEGGGRGLDVRADLRVDSTAEQPVSSGEDGPTGAGG